jgi:hypothetical protein
LSSGRRGNSNSTNRGNVDHFAASGISAWPAGGQRAEQVLRVLEGQTATSKLVPRRDRAIHPRLETTSDDIFVTKHLVSAFAGTDLEMILRAKGIHTLVLFGISTSGAVLSTLLDAFDADYRSSVIADCCADTDLELHEVLVKHLFPARGEVISAGELWWRWARVRRRRGDMRSATPSWRLQSKSKTDCRGEQKKGELSSQMTTSRHYLPQ